jgi:hypothetical protein
MLNKQKKKYYASLYSLAESFPKTTDNLRNSYHCQTQFLLLWAGKQKTFTKVDHTVQQNTRIRTLMPNERQRKKSRHQV